MLASGHKPVKLLRFKTIFPYKFLLKHGWNPFLGPISLKFRSMNSINSLWKPCKLLNNSTFYHLQSLIALPIQMICPANPDDSGFFFWGGGVSPPHTPPPKFCPWLL
jgi:hypothetical protein